MYTTNTAADLLKVKPRTITRYVETGQIAAQKVGRDWLIMPEELERFQATRRAPGRPREK